MKIFGYEINKVQNVAPILNAEKSSAPDIFKQQVKYPQTLTRTRQDISTYQSALASAENELYPNRQQLYRLYKIITSDAHLSSIIDTRKNAILSAKFIVTKNGKERVEKTDMLQKKWFYDFVNYSMDSIFYGYSLIQFGNLVGDEFTNLSVVRREYVKPELGIVVANPSLYTGQSYYEEPYSKWLIGVGEPRNLGLLQKAASLVLWKTSAQSAWAEYTQLFGNPFRIIKTNVRDEVTRSNAEGMLKDMGSSLYAVLDLEDDFQLKEANKQSASEIFNDLIDMCNNELSKLILGQTSTSDMKAYVGSANVHERIFKSINEADMNFLENIFTYQLVPFLNEHGLGFNNLKIEAEADDTITLENKAKIDIALLKYYELPPEYILETYGTPVTPRSKPVDTKNEDGLDNISNKLIDLYGAPEL